MVIVQRKRSKCEERFESIEMKEKEKYPASSWKKCLHPRYRRLHIFASIALIYVIYCIFFHNYEKVKDSRDTHAEVLRNISKTPMHILHEFCDSFGECFKVQNIYWNVGGKLAVQRMIVLRSNPGVALTMANLMVPDVLTPAYLDPLHWKVDKTTLVSAYNALQAAAGFIFGSLSFSNLDSRPHRVLQIGMGGGATTNFLATMPVDLSIDVVELEPSVYDVAKKYFDLTENERVTVKIEDGVKFMERAVNESTQYDSILLDACTTDINEAALCPAPVFRTPEVLENLSKLVGSNGVLSVNMFATRDREAQQEMIESEYLKFFLKCFSLHFNLEQKMLFCSNRKDFSWNGRKQRILGNLKDFDLRMRTDLYNVVSKMNE